MQAYCFHRQLVIVQRTIAKNVTDSSEVHISTLLTFIGDSVSVSGVSGCAGGSSEGGHYHDHDSCFVLFDFCLSLPNF